jgi:hypothetical protein
MHPTQYKTASHMLSILLERESIDLYAAPGGVLRFGAPVDIERARVVTRIPTYSLASFYSRHSFVAKLRESRVCPFL